MLTTILYILGGLLILAGIVCSVLTLPGAWLVFLGYLVSGFADGFENFSIILLIIVFIICVISTLLDNVVMIFFTHKLGSSKWGLIGAIVGGLVGLITGNIIGIILGPMIGVLLAELLIERKEIKEALKSSGGTILGWLCGNITKILINIVLAFLWLFIVIF